MQVSTPDLVTWKQSAPAWAEGHRVPETPSFLPDVFCEERQSKELTGNRGNQALFPGQCASSTVTSLCTSVTEICFPAYFIWHANELIFRVFLCSRQMLLLNKKTPTTQPVRRQEPGSDRKASEIALRLGSGFRNSFHSWYCVEVISLFDVA